MFRLVKFGTKSFLCVEHSCECACGHRCGLVARCSFGNVLLVVVGRGGGRAAAQRVARVAHFANVPRGAPAVLLRHALQPPVGARRVFSARRRFPRRDLARIHSRIYHTRSVICSRTPMLPGHDVFADISWPFSTVALNLGNLAI